MLELKFYGFISHSCLYKIDSNMYNQILKNRSFDFIVSNPELRNSLPVIQSIYTLRCDDYVARLTEPSTKKTLLTFRSEKHYNPLKFIEVVNPMKSPEGYHIFIGKYGDGALTYQIDTKVFNLNSLLALTSSNQIFRLYYSNELVDFLIGDVGSSSVDMDYFNALDKFSDFILEPLNPEITFNPDKPLLSAKICLYNGKKYILCDELENGI